MILPGTSGNAPELCRRLEDTGHMLRRPQRVPRRCWGRFTSTGLVVSAKHFLFNVICETFEMDCQPVE